MSDSKQFNPYLARQISDSKGRNYGHVFGDMFNNLGQNKEDAVKAENEKVKNEINKTTLDIAKTKVAEDNNFVSLMSSENPEEHLKNNPFKTSEYQKEAIDFIDKRKNKYSEEQQDENFKLAGTLFTKDDGSFDITGAHAHLKNKYKAGEIDMNTYHNVADAINKKAKYGLYREQMSEKDRLAIEKDKSIIAKNEAQANKFINEKNESKKYTPTNEEKLYDRLTKDEGFKKWYDEYSLNKKMGTGVRDMKFTNEFVKLALESNDEVKKSEAAGMYSNIYKDAKEVDKFFRNLAPTTFQLNEAQKLVNDGGAGVADEIKNQFSTWTGLNWDKTTQEGRTAFLSVLQPLAKTAMTGTVSDRDMKTLEKSFSSLWQSDEAVANALQNKTRQILFNAKQYANKHPNYIKLTGYDKSMNMLEQIVDNKNDRKDNSDNKTKVLFDMRDKKENTQEQTTTTQGNKPAWRNYE